MPRKKTHNDYVYELSVKNPNIEVVDNYIDTRTPIQHYCKKHKIYWNISPSSALKGSGCSECGKEKISAKHRKTHEQYVREVVEVNSDIEVVGEYKNSNIPILHRCKIHNITWNAYPNNILKGCGCCMCGNNVKKTHDEYVSEVSIINPFIEVIDTYINSRTKIRHRCKHDGYIWYVAPTVYITR